jgi:hypothetical protein
MFMKTTFHKATSIGLIGWLIANLCAFSQTSSDSTTVEKAIQALPVETGKSQTKTDTGEARKPIGTVNTPTSKVMDLPAYNVELVSKDGRKIIATVHKFVSGGISIQTQDGKIHVVALNQLSWETIAKLTGQELSYTRAGMDGFWVRGEAKCSKSR